jgi:hypothetical protein
MIAAPIFLAEYFAACDRMNEIAPLPLKRRPGKTKQLFAKPLKKIVRVSSGEFSEDTPAVAYWRLKRASEITMMVEQIYQISWRYLDSLFSAARECGYADALQGLEKVNGQIRQTVAEAFQIKARTGLDVATQAYALLEAFAVNDGRAHDEFAKKLARNVMEVLLRGGGGSRVAPAVRTIAA